MPPSPPALLASVTENNQHQHHHQHMPNTSTQQQTDKTDKTGKTDKMDKTLLFYPLLWLDYVRVYVEVCLFVTLVCLCTASTDSTRPTIALHCIALLQQLSCSNSTEQPRRAALATYRPGPAPDGKLMKNTPTIKYQVSPTCHTVTVSTNQPTARLRRRKVEGTEKETR